MTMGDPLRRWCRSGRSRCDEGWQRQPGLNAGMPKQALGRDRSVLSCGNFDLEPHEAAQNHEKHQEPHQPPRTDVGGNDGEDAAGDGEENPAHCLVPRPTKTEI